VNWKLHRKLEAELALAKRKDLNVILAKPTTFVNGSGCAVQKICQFFKIKSTDVTVVCDDVSFELGKYKLTERSGSSGHNGLIDILDKIGPGFVRFRIGVGWRKNKSMDLKDYVLGKFTDQELETVKSVMPEILFDLQLLIDKGPKWFMSLADDGKLYEGQEELQG
jgi:PTH1 family peptidyl-tRNA hydrolase